MVQHRSSWWFNSACIVAVLMIAALVVSGCEPTQPLQRATEQHLLFWHDWSGGDAALINDLLGKYEALNPDASVVDTAVPADLIYNEYVSRYAEGLEPDMILTDWVVAQSLIEKGYIKDLAGLVDTSDFDPGALSTVSENGAVYGLPLTVSTQVLFYNTESIPEPPATLDELKALVAHRDVELGLNPRFTSAYWGIRLFGGRPYDEQGLLQVDQGAFVNWLTTLKAIQTSSGFMLNEDQDVLRSGFTNGDLEFYVASAREYDELKAAMGDKLGVTRLPMSILGNPSGPIQQSSILLISKNAGEEETKRALALASFLTNLQQQTIFTRLDVGRLPANQNVRISPSMSDLVTQLAKQLRSSVSISLTQRRAWEEVATDAQTLFTGVMEGVVDIYAGAEEVRSLLDRAQGRVSSDELTSATVCPTIRPGHQMTLTLWHGWTDPETQVLNELIDDFHEYCPAITIEPLRDSDNAGLNTRYREAVQKGEGPDILIDSTQFLASLAADELIRPLGDVIDPARLTHFVPNTIAAMLYGGQLYGYPEASRSLALIYNPKLVSNPPQTLDDLLLEVDLDDQFAMPLAFFYDFWGLGAFGGRLFDENRQAVLDEGAMAAWLEWLRDAVTTHGFVFTTARPEAEDLFIQRKAAFLVSGPWSLPRLYNSMPKDEIAVTLLPAGPRNVASPMLEVEAFMVNPKADPETVEAAMAFARFVTSRPNQERLLATGVHVPANVTVDTSKDPVISGFRNQAHTAFPASQDNYWNVVMANGDAVYRGTVFDNLPIDETVATFNKLINDTNANLKR